MKIRLLITLIFAVALFSAARAEDDGLSIQFVPKSDESKPSSGSSIIEGPDLGEIEEPRQPPVLEPLSPPPALEARPTTAPKPAPTATPLPLKPAPTSTPIPAPPVESREVIHSERLVPETSTPPVIEKREVASVSIQVEHQASGGQYTPRQVKDLVIQSGERLRWRYSRDTDWRILEAYGSTEIHLSPTHYEISGNFFHSFRDGVNRVQVPTIHEGRERRDKPESIGSERLNLRLFVEVDAAAPKAPAPQGNCVVWQKGKLWLNDLVGGEVDCLVDGKMVDHLEVTSLIPGMIFILTPPSQLKVYAVKVDFEAEIFKVIGREKGRADRETAEMARLMPLADTNEKRLWCESRMAYEQEQSTAQTDKQRLFEMFLNNQLDAFGLIRSGFPLPHIQMAKTIYRHENLELSVGLFSDHLGKTLMPANAFLWINEAMPTPSTPFSYEIVDQSDPSFFGFDTRFRADGNKLIAEERFKGSTAWVQRNVVVDLYYYATFRPPQPQGPPGYLVDVTMDITGGLKRLNKDQMVSARLGTIQLTPDLFRIEVSPELLIGTGPMEKIVRDIIMQPLDLRAGTPAGGIESMKHLKKPC
ncbi:MAG: hypothetical protein UZ16_OP3001000074 [Candidatus Hinthialibacteria bacterium OLB16]|nr:MAG: hypothetical protein UZ16_OP3001000074 [Candidatus Hinthialibacteria bacterium OLB16]